MTYTSSSGAAKARGATSGSSRFLLAFDGDGSHAGALALNFQESRFRWLIKPVAVYAFFLLQFLVPSEFVDFQVKRHFGGLGEWFEQQPQQDRAFYIALAFGALFCLAYWFISAHFKAVLRRLTFSERLPAFQAQLEKAEYYHRIKFNELFGDVSELVTEKDSLVAFMMLELLLTDVRSAFRALCQCEDVRVAVYAEGYLEANHTRVLGLFASSEFGKNWFTARMFKYDKRRQQYGGYVGQVWKTKEVVSNTYKKFIVFTDRENFEGNIFDEPRSYLCLPIFRGIVKGEAISSVLTIDSGRRYDLLLTKRQAEKIDIITQSIRERAAAYIARVDFPEGDFCLVE